MKILMFILISFMLCFSQPPKIIGNTWEKPNCNPDQPCVLVINPVSNVSIIFYKVKDLNPNPSYTVEWEALDSTKSNNIGFYNLKIPYKLDSLGFNSRDNIYKLTFNKDGYNSYSTIFKYVSKDTIINVVLIKNNPVSIKKTIFTSNIKQKVNNQNFLINGRLCNKHQLYLRYIKK